MTSFFFVVEQVENRLDRYVVQKCPDLSRTRAQHLIAEGKVTVNGRPAKPGLRLSPGDRVDITVPPKPSPSLVAEDIPLLIVYEDDDVVVIDKPAGIAMHPAPGHPSHTIVNAVLAHCNIVAYDEASLRPGIVHRLDKDTSGLVVIVRTPAAYSHLSAQFKGYSVNKTYLALVKGQLSPDRGRIEAALGRDPRNRKRMAVVAGGREAVTDYKVLFYVSSYTLLEVHPRTGRTHQIRVHFSAIGHPVVGDSLYGSKSPFLKRQFLHAHRLGLILPSGGYREFVSPLPPDLQGALRLIAGEAGVPLPEMAGVFA